MTTTPGSLASNTTDWHIEEMRKLFGHKTTDVKHVRNHPELYPDTIRLANYLASKGIEPPIEAVTCPFVLAAEEAYDVLFVDRPGTRSEQAMQTLIALAKRGAEIATAQKGESIAQRQAREVMNPRSGGIAGLTGGQSYNAASPTEPLALLIAREALYRSAEGWTNAIEFGIIPKQHRASVSILRDEALKALNGWRPE